MVMDDHSWVTIRESTFPCGYGPRAIHLAQDHRTLFVGAKDGSIQGIRILSGPDGSPGFELSPVCGRLGSGIRSLSEWQSGWLWVARRTGELQLIHLGAPFDDGETHGPPYSLTSHLQGAEAGDVVRTLGLIDAERAFISFHHSGTWVLPRHPIENGDPGSALESSFEAKTRLHIEGQPLSEVSFIAPLESLAETRFVLGNRRGEVFIWDGHADEVTRVDDLWDKGEQPAVLFHTAMLWSSLRGGAGGKVRGVFLTTDRGVFLIYPQGGALLHRRLALPGLGTTCRALTFAERSGGRCHLWAADSRGDSHLYWTDLTPHLGQLNFRSSGISYAGTPSMLAVSWRQSEHSLVVGHIRRSNQVIFTEYLEVTSERNVAGSRWLLQYGTELKIREFWERSADEIASWHPYVQLSELFEVLARESMELKPLLEFLADPSTDVAWRILQETMRSDGAEKAREAVVLWTLSLLGSINRAGSELKDAHREAAYLGIVRWLFDLRRRMVQAINQENLEAAACDEVIHELDTSIGMVRKWGLFADIHGVRESLVAPIAAFRSQDLSKSDHKTRPVWSLERLTYEVLLFERGLDLRAEDRRGKLSGRNAWDIAVRELWGSTFFAVSWHWGGVELFELRQELGRGLELEIQLGIEPVSDAPGKYRFKVLPGEEVVQRNQHRRIQRLPYGHSRAVLFGSLSTGEEQYGYLITAPALPPDSPDKEKLLLWQLVSRDGKLTVRSPRPKVRSLKKESVYSLLDLGCGFGIAGLRSTGGDASCLLFGVTASQGALRLRKIGSYLYKSSAEQRMRAREPTERLRNRVWSLARVELPANAEKITFSVVVGCENGEILLLTLKSQDRGDSFQGEWSFVARMSSPVKTMTCRRVPILDTLRIVAGGADGAVVAWQELPQDLKDSKPTPRDRAFSSLWAFYEGEEISGLHLVHLPAEEESAMVLALTRDEQCFLYNDRVRIADAEMGERPCRIPVPGSRHGHFQRSRPEPPSAFASCLVPETALPQPFRDEDQGTDQDLGTGRTAVLVTASKHGVVRVLSVHYPHFHSLRLKKYDQILQQWWAIVKGNHQLRLVHAVYRSAPSVELILTRWLLDPHWPKKVSRKATEVKPEPWMLPRNLRSLLKLAIALEEGKEGNEEKAAEVYGHALDALREAFRLEDLRLYQEICEMLLRSGNFDLFTFAPLVDNPQRDAAAEIYLSVFDAIEHSLPQWQGSTAQQERLARMTVARNMVDGDTALRIADAAAEEKDAADEMEEETPFRDALNRRIRGVRDLVFKRDPRINLEALRAANLSLHRLCKRLVDRRNSVTGESKELAWEGIFEPYFRELTAAAARVFRSPLELNDALAHGFARTFALAVCACPSAAMRIAARMTETQLIADPNSQDDLCWLVPRQFRMLDQLGIPVPQEAQELFRIASRPPDQGFSPLDDPWLKGKDSMKLGQENSRDLRCLKLLYGLVGWFDGLEKRLSNRPEELAAWGAQLPDRLAGILQKEVITLYGHSADFWRWAVLSLCRRMLKNADEIPEPEVADVSAWKALALRLAHQLAGGDQDDARIQPRTVLLSHGIAAWSRDMIVALRERYDQLRIFQPEYRIFLRLFDRLQRSADAFPNSAAVRMNLVQGVLGHHLLEDLDEHILELQEIAHVLDPPMVRRYRKEVDNPKTSTSGDPLHPSERPPVAESFARYLTESSERAESLPKNLRTLFALLERAHPAELPTFEKLLDHFRGVGRKIELGKYAGEALLQNDYLSLRLILQELDRNARNHTRPEHSRIRVTTEPGCDERPVLRFDHSFPVTHDEINEFQQLPAKPSFNLGRLRLLHENKLQGPIDPCPNRTIASSGMGLYMANFAAAIVQWELRVDKPFYTNEPEGPRGRCIFRLVPIPRSGKGEA